MRKSILALLMGVISCFTLGVFTACGGGNGDVVGGKPDGGGKQCEHNLHFFPGRAGDCWNEKYLDYYWCSKCAGYFADADAQHEFTNAEYNVGYVHSENTEHYPAVATSCSQVGHPEYSYCPTCRQYFDADNQTINNVNDLFTINDHNFVGGVCTVCSSHTPSEGLEIDNHGWVCGIGDCTDTDIVIPNSYEKDGKRYPVVGVDNYAFDGANDGVDITSVRVSKGVSTIKRNAFFCLNNLKTVVIEGVSEGTMELEDRAIYGCENIQTLEIGEGVKKVNSETIMNSSSKLENVSLPNSLESSDLNFLNYKINYNVYAGGKYVGNATNPYLVLYGAESMETPVTAIHEDCKIIADSAFNSDGGVSVTDAIPDGVQFIGSNAFRNVRFITQDGIVNISKNVEEIGYGAFRGGEVGFVVDAENANYKSVNSSLLSKDGKTLIVACVTEMDSLYSVPNGVEVIERYAFEKCLHLKSVVLPDGLLTIGMSAFAGCLNLQSITIPATVTYIENEAFDLTPIIYVDRTETDCQAYSSDWATEWTNNEWVDNEKIIYDYKNNDVAKDGNIYVITDNYIYMIANQKAGIHSLGAVAPTGETLVLPASVSYKNATYPVTTIKRRTIQALTCKSLTIPDSYEEITDVYDQWNQLWGTTSDTITELTIGTGFTKIPCFDIELKSFRYDGTVENWLGSQFMGKPEYFLRNQTKFYIKQGNDFVELTSVTIPSGYTYNGQFGYSDSIQEMTISYGATFATLGDGYNSKESGLANNATINFAYFENEISAEVKAEFLSWRFTLVYAYGATNGSNDTFDYTVLGERVRITAYKGTDKTVTIPQKIADKNVVDFGTVFGGNTTIQTAVILARVDEIKAGAFANCTSLRLVYINGYVKNIKAGAFTNLDIDTNYGSTESEEYLTTGIYIGSNEQTKESGWIDKAYPVHYSYSLDDTTGILYLVDGNTKTITRYVGTATSVTLPADKGFTHIRSYAFKDCAVTEVVISNTVQEIGASAFENCASLTKITVSSSVCMIGADAFKGCASLTNVKFDDTDNWVLVEYATQTFAPVAETAFASEEALAQYLKENLTAGYVLMKGAVDA